MVRMAARLRAPARRAIFNAALALAFAFGFVLAIAIHQMMIGREIPQSKQDTYVKITADNGVILNAIRTSPDAILLKHIHTNVTDTLDNGINGGFFYNGDLISIAVMNDKPLKGEPGDYGSGWYNVDTKKGTLVWDETTGKLSVQIVQSAEEIAVADKHRYWAQGGVSMSLTDDAHWDRNALSEDMPAFEEKRLRSAVVYDRKRTIWLIVTDNPCTVEGFRSAIKENIGRGELVDGIFLDGDGSSQLKYGPIRLKGDSRPVYQMMALRGTGTTRN